MSVASASLEPLQCHNNFQMADIYGNLLKKTSGKLTEQRVEHGGYG